MRNVSTAALASTFAKRVGVVSLHAPPRIDDGFIDVEMLMRFVSARETDEGTHGTRLMLLVR
jgi:hypothetical protein